MKTKEEGVEPTYARNQVSVELGGDDFDDEGEGDLIDAQATLARALVNAAQPIQTDSLLAAAFLEMYLGKRQSALLVKMAFRYKGQQSGGFIKEIVKGIEGMAIINRAKVNAILGGGK